MCHGFPCHEKLLEDLARPILSTNFEPILLLLKIDQLQHHDSLRFDSLETSALDRLDRSQSVPHFDLTTGSESKPGFCAAVWPPDCKANVRTCKQYDKFKKKTGKTQREGIDATGEHGVCITRGELD
jgi:hypothetical protein